MSKYKKDEVINRYKEEDDDNINKINYGDES